MEISNGSCQTNYSKYSVDQVTNYKSGISFIINIKVKTRRDYSKRRFFFNCRKKTFFPSESGCLSSP